jgi:ribosomal protein S18 acetylase RimI-like enzyme
MINKKFIPVIFIVLTLFSALFANYSVDYATTLTLKNGNIVDLVPVTESPEVLESMKKVMQDPDTASTMRDLKPWPDSIVASTYAYYIASWRTFEDLIKMGEKPTSLALGFLLYNKKKEIVGLGGIQRSTRDGDFGEIFFCLLPPYRKQGIGTALAQHLINFYQEHYKNKTLEANVIPTNKPSIGLLKKMGFRPLLNKDGKPMYKTYPTYAHVTYQFYRYNPGNS